MNTHQTGRYASKVTAGTIVIAVLGGLLLGPVAHSMMYPEQYAQLASQAITTACTALGVTVP